MAEIATLPKLLMDAYEKYGDKKSPCARKTRGLEKYTWEGYYEDLKYFGLGFKPGESPLSLKVQKGGKK